MTPILIELKSIYLICILIYRIVHKLYVIELKFGQTLILNSFESYYRDFMGFYFSNEKR